VQDEKYIDKYYEVDRAREHKHLMK